jgi:hypothetical protein
VHWHFEIRPKKVGRQESITELKLQSFEVQALGASSQNHRKSSQNHRNWLHH